MGAGNQRLSKQCVAHARNDVQRGNKHLDAGDTALASKAYDNADMQLQRAQKLNCKGAKRADASVTATAVDDVRATLVSARARLTHSTNVRHGVSIPLPPLICSSNGLKNGPLVDKLHLSEPQTPSTIDTTGSCRGSLNDAHELLSPPLVALYSTPNPLAESTEHDTDADGNTGAAGIYGGEVATEYTTNDYTNGEYVTTEYAFDDLSGYSTEFSAASELARSSGLTYGDVSLTPSVVTGFQTPSEGAAAMQYDDFTTEYRAAGMANESTFNTSVGRSALRSSGTVRTSGQHVTFASAPASMSGESSTPRSGASIAVVQRELSISAGNPFESEDNVDPGVISASHDFGIADNMMQTPDRYNQAGDVSTSMMSGATSKSRYTDAMSTRPSLGIPKGAASAKASMANRYNQAGDVSTSVGTKSMVSGATSKSRYTDAMSTRSSVRIPDGAASAKTSGANRYHQADDLSTSMGTKSMVSGATSKSRYTDAVDDVTRRYGHSHTVKGASKAPTFASGQYGRLSFGDPGNASWIRQNLGSSPRSDGTPVDVRSLLTSPRPNAGATVAQSGASFGTSAKESFALPSDASRASEQDTAIGRSSSSGNSLSGDERDTSSASYIRTHLGDARNQMFPPVASPRGDVIPTLQLPFDQVFPYRGFAPWSPNSDQDAAPTGHTQVPDPRGSLPSGMPLDRSDYGRAAELPRKAAACKEGTVKQSEQAAFYLNPLGSMYDGRGAFTAWLHGSPFPESGQLEYGATPVSPHHRRSRKSSRRDFFTLPEKPHESDHGRPWVTDIATSRPRTVSLRNSATPKTSDEELSDALRQPSTPRSDASQDALVYSMKELAKRPVDVTEHTGSRADNMKHVRAVSPRGAAEDLTEAIDSPRFGSQQDETLLVEDKSPRATRSTHRGAQLSEGLGSDAKYHTPLESGKEQAVVQPDSFSEATRAAGESAKTGRASLRSRSTRYLSVPSHGGLVDASRKQSRISPARSGTQRDATRFHSPTQHAPLFEADSRYPLKALPPYRPSEARDARDPGMLDGSHYPPKASHHDRINAPVDHSRDTLVPIRGSRHPSVSVSATRYPPVSASDPRYSSVPAGDPRHPPEILPEGNTILMGGTYYTRILPLRRAGDSRPPSPPYEEHFVQIHDNEPSHACVAPAAKAVPIGHRLPADLDLQNRGTADYENAVPYPRTPQRDETAGYGTDYENVAPYPRTPQRDETAGYGTDYENVVPYPHTPQRDETAGYGTDYENVAPYPHTPQRDETVGYGTDYENVAPYPHTPQGDKTAGYGTDYENVAPYSHTPKRDETAGYGTDYENVAPYPHTPQRNETAGYGTDYENVAPYPHTPQRGETAGYGTDYENVAPYPHTPQGDKTAGYGTDYENDASYQHTAQRGETAGYGESYFQPPADDDGRQPETVYDGWTKYEGWPQEADYDDWRSEVDYATRQPETDYDGWKHSVAFGGEQNTPRTTCEELGRQGDMYSPLKLLRPPQLSTSPETLTGESRTKYATSPTPASSPSKYHFGHPSGSISSSPALVNCSPCSVAHIFSPSCRVPMSCKTSWPPSLVDMSGHTQVKSPSLFPSQMRAGAAALQAKGRRSGMDSPCVHTAMAARALQKAAPQNQSDWASSMSGLTGKELALARTLRNPYVEWDDIFGYEDVKELLRSHFIRRDELYVTPGRVSGMLLYGPPGVGKTMLAQALGSEIGSTFLAISAAKLSYVGEASDILNTLFPLAKKLKNVTIFIDDVESIFGSKSTWTTEDNDRIKRDFFEGLATINRMDARILCATNSPFHLSTAFLRNMTQKIYVPLPVLNVRQDMIKFFCNAWGCKLEPSVLDVVPNVTNGYSARDLIAVLIRAISCAGGMIDGSGSVYVSMAYFMTAVQAIQPTVSTSMVERFFEWDQQWRNTRVCAGRWPTWMSRAKT